METYAWVALLVTCVLLAIFRVVRAPSSTSSSTPLADVLTAYELASSAESKNLYELSASLYERCLAVAQAVQPPDSLVLATLGACTAIRLFNATDPGLPMQQ